MVRINIKKEKDLKKIITLAIMKTAEDIITKIENDLREQMNREFFTLKELKQKDHPYAKRHFKSVDLNSLATLRGNPYIRLISRRRGGFDNVLQKEIKIKPMGFDVYLGKVYFDLSKGPKYVSYIVKGTKKLIPRPLPYFYLIRNKNRLQRHIKNVLLHNLKYYLRYILPKSTTKTLSITGEELGI